METPAAVAAAFGYEPIDSPELVGSGTLNWNYRLETTDGPLFIRKHRAERTRDHLRAEHAFVAWVAERGIPAPLPQSHPDGETILEHEGSLWALYPWIDAAPPVRGAMTERQVWAAGEMHGRIHAVLDHHPARAVRVERLGYDTPASMALLEHLAAIAFQRGHEVLIEAIQLQRSLLEVHGAQRSYESLRQGQAHGDYHDQQLLYRGDAVAAVTDWELFGVRPLVSELIRSLVFSQIMEGPHMPAYVAGYREHIQLSESDCRLGMERWWQGRLHTSWVFSAYLLQGNERVAEFIPQTVRELKTIADPTASRELTERFVRAATA